MSSVLVSSKEQSFTVHCSGKADNQQEFKLLIIYFCQCLHTIIVNFFLKIAFLSLMCILHNL